MKSLLIVRHAKSSWDFPDWNDIDRPLNSRGMHNAYEMAHRHFRSLSKPELVISSPATRALHTAVILMRQWQLPLSKLKVDAGVYEGFSSGLADIVRSAPDDIQKLMIVGHNPGITEFVNRHQETHRIDNMPTCSMALFKLDMAQWQEFDADFIGSLDMIDYPKKAVN